MAAEVKPIIPVVTKPVVDKTPAPVVETAATLVSPVKAIHKINGTIEPGVMFRPETAALRDELFQLEAVADLDEADLALFRAIEASKSTDEFA